MIKTAAILVTIVIIFALYVMLTDTSKKHFNGPLDCPYRDIGPRMRMRRHMYRTCPYHENCPYHATCPFRENCPMME
jgi:hypothetical protein